MKMHEEVIAKFDGPCIPIPEFLHPTPEIVPHLGIGVLAHEMVVDRQWGLTERGRGRRRCLARWNARGGPFTAFPASRDSRGDRKLQHEV